MPISEHLLKKHHNTEGSAGQNNASAEAQANNWSGLKLDQRDGHQCHTIQQTRFLKHQYAKQEAVYVRGEPPIDHSKKIPRGTSWATKAQTGFVFGATPKTGRPERALSGARRSRKVPVRTYDHDELMAWCRPKYFGKGTTPVHFNSGMANHTDAMSKTETGGKQKFLHVGDQHVHLPVRGGGQGFKQDWENDDPAHSMRQESFLRSTQRKLRRGVS